jgi:uncharacterized cupredoxin-like copper-binding protein
MIHGIAILLSAVLSNGSTVVPKAPPVVIVHAKDFSFTAPKTIKSGTTTFHLVNDGKELHHLTIIKLAKGKTMADFGAAMKTPGPPPAWITEVGGPNPALPGGSADATLTLDAGDYVMVCVIPSPGETAPHATKGMVSTFTVTSEKNEASAPATDATIRMSDYAFSISKPLSAGHHVLNVVNDAAQPHELVIAELPPGKTMTDIGHWIDKDLMRGPPPGKPVGGMSVLAKGRSGSFSIDLKPGRYGLICLYPDRKDGKSHFAHGMVQEITVAAK